VRAAPTGEAACIRAAFTRRVPWYCRARAAAAWASSRRTRCTPSCATWSAERLSSGCTRRVVTALRSRSIKRTATRLGLTAALRVQAKAVSDPLKKPLSLLCAGLDDVAKYTQGLASGALTPRLSRCCTAEELTWACLQARGPASRTCSASPRRACPAGCVPSARRQAESWSLDAFSDLC
jgi:hypothetical protein